MGSHHRLEAPGPAIDLRAASSAFRDGMVARSEQRDGLLESAFLALLQVHRRVPGRRIRVRRSVSRAARPRPAKDLRARGLATRRSDWTGAHAQADAILGDDLTAKRLQVPVVEFAVEPAPSLTTRPSIPERTVTSAGPVFRGQGELKRAQVHVAIERSASRATGCDDPARPRIAAFAGAPALEDRVPADTTGASRARRSNQSCSPKRN